MAPITSCSAMNINGRPHRRRSRTTSTASYGGGPSRSYWLQTVCMKIPKRISVRPRGAQLRAITALCLDDDLRRGAARRRKAVTHAFGDFTIVLGVLAIRRGRHDRRAAVGFLADRDIEGYFAQEWDSESLSLAPRAAVTEYVRARAALWADESAHVFDDAKDRHIDPPKHGNAAPRIDQGKILRGRNDDRALERHLLRHGELGVAGAGRHVHHHHVERAPFDLAQHLRQSRHHHRPTPNHRGFLFDEEADRHHRHTEALDRPQPIA